MSSEPHGASVGAAMFDGHIGVWEIVAWITGLLLITLIDVIKDRRKRGQREST